MLSRNFYNQRWVAILWRNDLWAVTIGSCTFFTVPQDMVSNKWHAHEDFHKKQWRDGWYIGFLLKYLYFNVKYGYWNNPYEVAARDYASREEFNVYMEA